MNGRPRAASPLSGVVYGVRLHGRLPAEFRPWLLPAGGTGGFPPRADVEVAWSVVARLPPVAATWTSEPARGEADLRFALFSHPRGFGLAVSGEENGRFRCTPERIEIEWAGDPAAAPHHLVGYALPLWLETQGVPVLHGSAVTTGDRAVGFLGPSGVGKSTLAVELARLGCGFVADDGLALERRGTAWHCLAGPPLARLWPGGISARLGVAPEGLPRVRGGGEKRLLELPGAATRTAHPRLAALYLLERGDDAGGAVVHPPLAPSAALLGLLAHGVAAAPAAALGLSVGRLDRLAEVAAEIPVRRLSLPGGLESANEVLATISSC